MTACANKVVNEGAGYSLLTPSSDTAVYIVKHDKPFAQQVAAHNRQCWKDKACIQ